MDNNNILSINKEVLAKMAGLAALDTEGVAALAKIPSDVKTIFHTGEFTRSVKVNTDNDCVELEIYIKVSNGFAVTKVAEAVQAKIKDDIQNMTGSAVTKVNVVVADVEFAEDEQ